VKSDVAPPELRHLFLIVTMNIGLLRSHSSLNILEPRSGKRILAWRVSARLIVTGRSSPERAADILSLSVALSGLAVLILVFPGLTSWAKDLALLRSAYVAFGDAAIHHQIVL
jgi:hypothetical protein